MVTDMADDGNGPASPRGRAAKPPRYKYTFSAEVPLRAGAAVFYGRREDRPPRKKRATFRDLQELLLLGFYLCVAVAVPVTYWDRICRFVAHLRARKHRRKLFATLKRDLAAIAPEADSEAFFSEYRTMLHRRRLYYMAHIGGWRWKPRIIVEGAEEVRAEVSRGEGVVVWCENLAAQTLIGKRALHQAGIEAYQVHARDHGLSTSAFGKRVINPILFGIENRFLKGRIAFDASESIHVTRRVLEALGAGAVVAIVANTYHARRFVEVPIAARGYAHLATTPANLVAKGKTRLVTMSTVETVPFTEFRAVIRSHALPEGEGGRDEAVAEVISAFRDSFEGTVVNFPAQCMGMGRDLVSYSLDARAGFRS